MIKMTKYLLLLCIAVISCSTDSPIQNDNRTIIELDYNSQLIFEDQGELDTRQNTIEFVVRETLSLVNDKMSVETIKIIVKNDPNNAIPEIGIGGFNPNQNEIIISTNVGFNDLDGSIASELGPMIAHEIHHLKRRRSVGYGSTLLEACVSEGLADAFSIEIFGIDPPIWSTALSQNELADWVEIAKAVWNDNPYNHNKWFFGTTPEIPRWTGYSIGFELVQDFLSNNPELKPSKLFNEPANSFIN